MADSFLGRYVDELLGYGPRPLCVCGRIIPTGIAYYGFPLSADNDEPMAWVDERHDRCLAEWGFVRCDDNHPAGVLGIRHRWDDDEEAA